MQIIIIGKAYVCQGRKLRLRELIYHAQSNIDCEVMALGFKSLLSLFCKISC